MTLLFGFLHGTLRFGTSVMPGWIWRQFAPISRTKRIVRELSMKILGSPSTPKICTIKIWQIFRATLIRHGSLIQIWVLHGDQNMFPQICLILIQRHRLRPTTRQWLGPSMLTGFQLGIICSLSFFLPIQI